MDRQQDQRDSPSWWYSLWFWALSWSSWVSCV